MTDEKVKPDIPNLEEAMEQVGLGMAFEAFDAPDQAVAAYKQAMAIAPTWGAPHRLLGQLYKNSGLFEEAVAALKKAIDLDPNDAEAYFELGRVYDRERLYEEAHQAYRRAATLEPDNPWSLLRLGGTAYELGDFEEARAAYKRVMELPDDDDDGQKPSSHAEAWLGMSNVVEGDDAVAAALRSIAMGVEDSSTYNNLGNAYLDLARYDDAIAAYQRAIELRPHDATPHNGLGAAYYHAGRYDEAIDSYKRSAALEPRDEAPHINLATAYIDLGRLDEARAELEEYLRLSPQSVFDQKMMLGVLARHQGLREADKLFQTALHGWDRAWREPGMTRSGKLQKKAIALLCAGRREEAMATMREAVAVMLPGDDPETALYELLRTAPNPPEGLEEMVAIRLGE